MNMTEDTSSWQSAASTAEECQYLNQIYYKEDLKVIFLTETECKIRFIYVGFNCLLEKSTLNFHFDYWKISL